MIVTTDDKHYGDIADAIRNKLGTTDGYKPEDMAAAVGDIESGGGNYQSKSVTYTSNGTSTVTPDAGYDALSEVNVTVDVSGGGGAETCTLTIVVDREPGGNNDARVYATAPDGAQTYSVAGTYTILKNSVLGAYYSYQVSGSYQIMLPRASGSVEFYKATGNLTVVLVKGF